MHRLRLSPRLPQKQCPTRGSWPRECQIYDELAQCFRPRPSEFIYRGPHPCRKWAKSRAQISHQKSGETNQETLQSEQRSRKIRSKQWQIGWQISRPSPRDQQTLFSRRMISQPPSTRICDHISERMLAFTFSEHHQVIMNVTSDSPIYYLQRPERNIANAFVPDFSSRSENTPPQGRGSTCIRCCPAQVRS